MISSSPAIMRSSVDLPQPEGPTNDDELAIGDVEVDALDDLHGAETLANVLESTLAMEHVSMVPT